MPFFAIGFFAVRILGILIWTCNLMLQVRKIQEILGSPSPKDVEFIKNVKARDFLTSLDRRPRVAWERLLPRASRYKR